MRHVRPLAWIVLTILIAFLVSGCSSAASTEPNRIPLEITDAEQGRDEPIEKNAEEQTDPAQEEKSDNNLEISSSNGKDEKDDKEKGKKDNDSPFNKSDPVLIGLRIGESKSALFALHGESLHSFVMDDPIDPIVAYDYGKFLVGIDRSDHVKFIEITSPEVSALPGVRIGSDIAAALNALGEPDSKTSHVWNYTSDNAVLKFDIDPNTQQILSIKLFSID